MSVLYTCVLPCVLLCACVWWRWRRAYRLLEQLVRYPTVPLIGNLHQVWGDSEYMYKELNVLSKMMDVAKKPFVSWLGPLPVVAVSDPLNVKAVTNTYADKPYMYRFSRNWLGDGLITAPENIWKHTSRKLSGVFNTTMVDGYQDIFNAQAHKLMTLMKTEAGRAPFDVSHKYIAMIALETIYQVALGLPSSSECVTEEYHRVFSRTLQLYLQRAVRFPLHLEFLYRLTPAYKELRKCEDVLNTAVEKVIKKRKEEEEPNSINNKTQLEINDLDIKNPSFRSYLDVLLELSASDPVFSPKQIRSELSTIIAAGHETVANALTMCLLMIGSHSDVQDKLYAELKDIFSSSNRPVEKEDLVRMQYCEAILNETLRMYPTVPICLRQADKDLPLKSCTIPKEAVCAINIWGCGRSEHIWGEDADIFRPERWLECPDTNPFFIPFSYGKRACIGKRYSMAILKTTLAYCVRELVIKADTSFLRMKIDVTLQPFAGHSIQVRMRN